MSSPAQTLQELIDQAMVKQGVTSLRRLEAKSKELGVPVSNSLLSLIYRHEYRSRPGKSLIHALSVLAGVSYETAHRAAGLGAPAVAYNPPPEADLLTAKERDVVNAVIRTIVEAHERSSAEPKVDQDSTHRVAYVLKSDYDYPDELTRSDEAT